LADGEPLVDARRVAEFLGTSRAYVLKAALLGRLPAIMLPSLSGKGERVRWRFRLTEVEQSLAWKAKPKVRSRR
jgi:hypothetical protein